MPEPTTLSNRFFVCLPGQYKALPLNPFAYQASEYPKFIEIDYLAGAFQTVEQSELKNLTFYVTWNVDKLPTYGDKVVVVLMGDEWCRFPHYLGRVRAVFRSHANWPTYTGNLTNGITYSNIISGVQFLRLHLIGLPGRLHYLVSRLRGHNYPTKTYIIPLGYANQQALPVMPLKDRTTDVCFMGSVNNELPSKRSLKYWLRSPKAVAREQMLESARALQQKRPDRNVYLQGTEQFTGNLLTGGQPLENEKNRYSSRLMDTKICLVPRGSSLETFRLFEAVRYGCIAICEQLPKRWYYDSLPAVQIDSWSNLEGVVDELLGDSEKLERLHQEALSYWQTRCSEAVLGRFIAARLAPAEIATKGESRLSLNPDNARQE